ncbi:hypothetical protein PR048_032511 [Dryococelus australis]|uniref:Uncharacterized protein n=1 Tax=Dryococelus australis TaxID=614101 RepID=A0ABQ9G2E4_9NEOP|nr:hypothetical protein PR048_032511 [Dryococelus australis]
MEEELGLIFEWNFFASSHVKSAVDGVGATFKRHVWMAVKCDRNIHIGTARDFHDHTEVLGNETILNNYREGVLPIPQIQASHHFRVYDCNNILVGKTSSYLMTKVAIKVQHDESDFDTSVPVSEVKCCLRYNNVYSDSDSEDNSANPQFTETYIADPRVIQSGARETGDPRENPSTIGIVRHDSHMRKSGSDPEGQIEPDSPWWEVSTLTARPPRPLNRSCEEFYSYVNKYEEKYVSRASGAISGVLIRADVPFGVDGPVPLDRRLPFATAATRLSHVGVRTIRGIHEVTPSPTYPPFLFHQVFPSRKGRVKQCPWSAGFLRDLPSPPAPTFGCCSMLASLHLHRLPETSLTAAFFFSVHSPSRREENVPLQVASVSRHYAKPVNAKVQRIDSSDTSYSDHSRQFDLSVRKQFPVSLRQSDALSKHELGQHPYPLQFGWNMEVNRMTACANYSHIKYIEITSKKGYTYTLLGNRTRNLVLWVDYLLYGIDLKRTVDRRVTCLESCEIGFVWKSWGGGGEKEEMGGMDVFRRVEESKNLIRIVKKIKHSLESHAI